MYIRVPIPSIICMYTIGIIDRGQSVKRKVRVKKIMVLCTENTTLIDRQ